MGDALRGVKALMKSVVAGKLKVIGIYSDRGVLGIVRRRRRCRLDYLEFRNPRFSSCLLDISNTSRRYQQLPIEVCFIEYHNGVHRHERGFTWTRIQR